jgi:DnaJ-domain-containing protein 1
MAFDTGERPIPFRSAVVPPPMTASSPLPNHYELLQVSPGAEPDVIDAAYKQLARKYHPDVNPEPWAAETMVQINTAYSVLRDPVLRSDYDRCLALLSTSAPAGAVAAVVPTPPDQRVIRLGLRGRVLEHLAAAA